MPIDGPCRDRGTRAVRDGRARHGVERERCPTWPAPPTSARRPGGCSPTCTAGAAAGVLVGHPRRGRPADVPRTCDEANGYGLPLGRVARRGRRASACTWPSGAAPRRGPRRAGPCRGYAAAGVNDDAGDRRLRRRRRPRGRRRPVRRHLRPGPRGPHRRQRPGRRRAPCSPCSGSCSACQLALRAVARRGPARRWPRSPGSPRTPTRLTGPARAAGGWDRALAEEARSSCAGSATRLLVVVLDLDLPQAGQRHGRATRPGDAHLRRAARALLRGRAGTGTGWPGSAATSSGCWSGAASAPRPAAARRPGARAACDARGGRGLASAGPRSPSPRAARPTPSAGPTPRCTPTSGPARARRRPRSRPAEPGRARPGPASGLSGAARRSPGRGRPRGPAGGRGPGTPRAAPAAAARRGPAPPGAAPTARTNSTVSADPRPRGVERDGEHVDPVGRRVVGVAGVEQRRPARPDEQPDVADRAARPGG